MTYLTPYQRGNGETIVPLTPQIAPYGQSRNANDSIYPLRGADGLTWAERKNRAALERLANKDTDNG